MLSGRTTNVARVCAAYSRGGSLLVLLAVVAMLLAPAVVRAEQYHFLTVPFKKASKRSPVEVRLEVRNNTAYNKWYKVQFYIDNVNNESYRLMDQPLSVIVNVGQSYLFSYHWDPSSFSGNHTLYYTVDDWTWNPNVTEIGQGSSPITLVNGENQGYYYKSPSIPTVGWIELAHTWYPEYGNANNNYTAMENKIADMHSVEQDLIVVAYVEDLALFNPGGGAYYPSALQGLEHEHHVDEADIPVGNAYSVLQCVLQEAEDRGMKVILGLGRGTIGKLVENMTPTERTTALSWYASVADELWDLYGANGSVDDYSDTIYGWYLPHEAVSFNSDVRSFYNSAADNLRQYGKARVVMISPCADCYGLSGYVGGMKPDIFAYQDGLGYGANSLNDLTSEFSDYASWHSGTGKHLWANMETYRQNNPTIVSDMDYDVAFQIFYEKPHVQQIMFNDFIGCMYNGGGIFYYPYADYLWADYDGYYYDYYKNM